jgi:hypothetical protein
LARTIYIYGVYSVFLAGKLSNIRSKMVHIYGYGLPYIPVMLVRSEPGYFLYRPVGPKEDTVSSPFGEVGCAAVCPAKITLYEIALQAPTVSKCFGVLV